MKSLQELKQADKLIIEQLGIDGGCGDIYLNGTRGKPLSVVFSWGGGWEHVSVSYPNKTPSWDEMCKVKDMFWNDDECVIQFHPPKSEYVNIHPHCLHLWRRCGGEGMITPPKMFV